MSEDRTAPVGRTRKRSCLPVLVNGFLILVWLALSVPLAWSAYAALADRLPPDRKPPPGGTDYLIVSPPALQTSAKAWAEYRRSAGYVPDILTVSEPDFPILRESIQEIYADSGRPYPFYVLLLGHAHPDSSSPDAYLPPGLLDTGDFAYYLSGAETIASDSLYAAAGDDFRLLPLTIGRVPARDDGEALRVLARVKEYESRPPIGAGRTRIDLIASDSGFGPQFDDLVVTSLEYLVRHYLSEYYQWRILYGNPASPFYLPAEDFPQTIAERMNSGSLLMMYIGHGLMDHLGPVRTPEGKNVPAFELEDLPLITGAEGTVVALLGCLIGEYDSAGDQASLAESLLLAPGGAAATYAASRITSPEGNAVLVKDLLAGMLQRRYPEAGTWTGRAESAFLRPSADSALWMALGRLAIPELHRLSAQRGQSAAPSIPGRQHYNLGQHAYNLFGDPAMRIAYPVPDLAIRPAFPWMPRLDAVSFAGGGLPAEGKATVALLAPPGSETEGNDPVMAEMAVDAGAEGTFAGRLELPDGVRSGRYILKVETVDGSATRVGSRTVHLGWPPVGAVLLSVELWRILVSLMLLWNARFLVKRIIPVKKKATEAGE